MKRGRDDGPLPGVGGLSPQDVIVVSDDEEWEAVPSAPLAAPPTQPLPLSPASCPMALLRSLLDRPLSASLAARGIAFHKWSKDICDKGSRFVAHAATGVKSRADVDDVLRCIVQSDKAIAGATHPAIMAFRVGAPLKEGCDDDGEKWGGGKVLAVLRRRGALNAMAVVTRWYGGRMLGPARFTYISTAADGALAEMVK